MFERDIKACLNSRGEDFSDGTASHSALDFFLPRHGVYIDAKEKRRRFSIKNWPETSIPQEHLFIIDDLAVRKLLLHAPGSFFLIRDSSTGPAHYHVYSIVDLLCMPKQRCRRPIERTMPTFKGKWLVDLRHASSFNEMGKAIDYIIGYRKKFDRIFEHHLDCWGRYYSEKLSTGGITREPRHWREDAEVIDKPR